ncbi:MAG: hypothetical protein NC548_28415 [Lachnospiraceae bacterium]|nr:hypothetical protein [Lachnospiraceae bacterium]MCM1232016.1 hypothetical protein [Ruminococcus flavefaciens]
MEKYKPGWMGKVMPVDDPSKLTDFVKNKYEPFTKIYDTCKDQSDKITDIRPVAGSGDSDSISIKLNTESDVMEKIKEATKDNASISVKGDVVTAKTD